MREMTEHFEITEEIPHSQFIETWEREEQENEHGSDGFTLQRIGEFRAFKDLKYYVIKLSPKDLNSLMLSHHYHDGVQRICPEGEAYPGVISKYHNWRFEGQYDGCFERLAEVEQFINAKLNEASTLWESGFVLGRVFRTGNQALPEYCHSFPSRQLRTLNFHRFVAYGLWCTAHGYQPAKAHYFTHASAGA
jgi:hypothetical protein